MIPVRDPARPDSPGRLPGSWRGQYHTDRQPGAAATRLVEQVCRFMLLPTEWTTRRVNSSPPSSGAYSHRRGLRRPDQPPLRPALHHRDRHNKRQL